jgi:hypothetical protein
MGAPVFFALLVCHAGAYVECVAFVVNDKRAELAC